MKKRIAIIGATGSIGTQAVDVVMQNPDIFDVVFVSSFSNEKDLDVIASKINASYQLLMSKPNSYDEFLSILDNEKIDLILHAASGIEAVRATYDIAKRGIDIALANKESIVTAGKIIMDKVYETGLTLIPVDSEHSAIFQCIANNDRLDIEKITLTASGGPFRNRPQDSFKHISLNEALNHPKWSMGQKISVDSATMMNKGLELIEAKYLFDVSHELLDVVIHPQSIIHSYVAFNDGSTIAQMGTPDMRIPISYGLGFPSRITSGADKLDLTKVGTLSFEKPDFERFECLKIALEVLQSDSNTHMIAMNVANDVAVNAFLLNKISFNDIPSIIKRTLDSVSFKNAKNIDEACENCDNAMSIAQSFIK